MLYKAAYPAPAIDAGQNPTLARLMRHTDPRTSKQYYVEPFDEDLREASELK